MSKCECEYKADLNMQGEPYFKQRGLGVPAIVRVHCVHCRTVRHATKSEWARLKKAAAAE